MWHCAQGCQSYKNKQINHIFRHSSGFEELVGNCDIGNWTHLGHSEKLLIDLRVAVLSLRQCICSILQRVFRLGGKQSHVVCVRGTKSICPFRVHTLSPSCIPLVSPGLVILFMGLINTSVPVISDILKNCYCCTIYLSVHIFSHFPKTWSFNFQRTYSACCK